MSIEIGHAAAFIALGCAVLAASCGLFTRRGQLTGRASIATFVFLLIAMVMLVHAFAVSDFSVALVAGNSGASKPFLYKLAASWGNHEGSMLLWCLVSAGFGAGAALLLPAGDMKTRTLGVQASLNTLFCLFLLVASSPFARLVPAPLEGKGLNPLLQHPVLAIHPPFLYLGYVGFSLVFSLAVAYLLLDDRDTPRQWARRTRPWAIAALSMLTVGIFLGSLWAYYELGWGGWWFWDPVENASLMPWLTGVALVHSLTVTGKNGQMARWSLLLALLTFCLSLIGAFLVRSGILTSVHAFALSPERGLLLLFGTLLIGSAGLGIHALKAHRLTTNTSPAASSFFFGRVEAIALNNLFLCTATATVLAGTFYPLLIEALTGEKVSVGPPYFNLTIVPIMAVILIIAPVAQAGRISRAILGPVLLTALAALFVYLLASATLWTVAGTAIGVWLIGATLHNLARHMRIVGLPAALIGPGGQIGAALAHIGLGIFVIGAVAESGGRIERTFIMAPGEDAAFIGWTLTMKQVEAVEGPNYHGQRAVIDASKDRRAIRLYPEKRLYFPAGSATTETAVDKGTLGHFHIALGEPVAARPGAWTMRVSFNPLMDWVFAGMLLVALGIAAALVRRQEHAPT